ncbi:hypothetical protein SEVIR_9G416450v4 [Setaria viridis]
MLAAAHMHPLLAHMQPLEALPQLQLGWTAWALTALAPAHMQVHACRAARRRLTQQFRSARIPPNPAPLRHGRQSSAHVSDSPRKGVRYCPAYPHLYWRLDLLRFGAAKRPGKIVHLRRHLYVEYFPGTQSTHEACQ